MAADAIANYDVYGWVAIGLFIVGLFGIMVYERSSSRARQRQDQRPPAGAASSTGATGDRNK